MSNAAYRHGLCDGLLGRDNKNPYNRAWNALWKSVQYEFGYFDGKLKRQQDNITIYVPRL
jgi:hypothetical protein